LDDKHCNVVNKQSLQAKLSNILPVQTLLHSFTACRPDWFVATVVGIKCQRWDIYSYFIQYSI